VEGSRETQELKLLVEEMRFLTWMGEGEALGQEMGSWWRTLLLVLIGPSTSNAATGNKLWSARAPSIYSVPWLIVLLSSSPTNLPVMMDNVPYHPSQFSKTVADEEMFVYRYTRGGGCRELPEVRLFLTQVWTAGGYIAKEPRAGLGMLP
jgi:hypothetical protein